MEVSVEALIRLGAVLSLDCSSVVPLDQLFIEANFPSILSAQLSDGSYEAPSPILVFYVFSFILLTIYLILNLGASFLTGSHFLRHASS